MNSVLPADAAPSRYVVGIDLGTTNSAVCYVDTEESPWRVATLAIWQLVAPGQVEARETLPSFHYQPAAAELPEGALKLPWDHGKQPYAVGFFARDAGAKSPGRSIASAKSWLCHNGVDRTAELLPWQGAADVERLSPVEASSRYLLHIRQAWDHRFPGFPLAEQDIVLTLPASFDEVARELTVQAGKRAGLPRLVLIEEPQAAFYAWIDRHADDWRQRVSPGQMILVCDIGGGTTDFTLIRVRESGAEKTIQFHRTAVGDHLILGGDNLDLALAHAVEQKLASGGKLDPRRWDMLVRQCRHVKEQLLSEGGPERATVNLPGASSKLIGGGVQSEVSREEAHRLLIDGFFPHVPLDSKPTSRQSGFQEFGLPYAADPAATKYLAAFLTAHRNVEVEKTGSDRDPARPDIVLFNGGVFASAAIQARLLDVLSEWFRTASDRHWRPEVLNNPRLDLAVAQGAAYYGMVRRGEGVRIAAGLARSYYLGVASREASEAGAAPAAVCLVPGNATAGQEIELADRRFELMVSQPVQFPLYVSSSRLADRPGDVLPVDPEQMRALPPIRTVLHTRKKSERGAIGVTLHARLSEIGTLEMWCSQVGQDRQWRLEFDVRSATQTDRAAEATSGETEGVIEDSAWQACETLIDNVFGSKANESPEGLVKRLTAALDTPRGEWPPSLIRRLWQALLERESGRRKSAMHEARWLNLLGYALRPGFGVAMDDWRVNETWRTVHGKLAFATPACRNEAWIVWRRLAGGLSAGQQRSVADPLLAETRAIHRRHEGGKSRGDVNFTASEAQEAFRLLGSLELLPIAVKIELGEMLLDLASRKKLAAARSAILWSLGRLGARAPVYAPLNAVVPAKHAAAWLRKLIEGEPGSDAKTLQFTIMQLARRTDDRYRDLAADQRRLAIDWLELAGASEHLVHLVSEGGELARDEQDQVFGEALPQGLWIG